MSKGHFISSGVQLHHLRGKRKAILTLDVIYSDSHNRIHTARPGLLLDGRSGRGLYYLIGTPYDPRHLEATVIHDLYCALAAMLTGEARAEMRRKGDVLFAECLRTLPVPGWKCRSMPWAVRQQAKLHKRDPIADWSDNFVSRDAVTANSANPFVIS